MRFALPLLLTLLPALAAAQCLDDAYAQAEIAVKRATFSTPRCWTRAKSAAADAAGMPERLCLAALKPGAKTVSVSGTARLPGGAQTEVLSGDFPLFGVGNRMLATIYHWNAGPGESDEESLVQLEFLRDASGAVAPTSARLIAWHQCPERGCSYACGVTSVEFTPEPAR